MSGETSSKKGKKSQERFKILMATDCHLGYEAKTKRDQTMDSVVTFEEILKLALESDVDFILLGGDLFHDAKPSQRVILDCVDLLKKYCLGKRAINFEFLSNPKDIFPNQKVNYEDENLNISMPIFTIHGNHDNPSFESTGTLDLLMGAGLLNYFGKWSALQEIKVTPMIFQKGSSLLAIYGLGYVSEQRLSRLLREGKVHFLRPANMEECFSILVIHQNRAKHAENEYIEENRFPPWFDLILWGHEHECRLSPEEIKAHEDEKYFITQPGSSVATSLCDGEAKLKHVGILHLRQKNFRMEPLRLQTVRPFIFRDISLSEIIQKGYCDYSPEGIIEYIDDYIQNTAIPAAEKLLTGHEKQPKKPLIRVRVSFNQDHQMFETSDLAHKYHDKVANAKDMIIFKREKASGQKKIKNDPFDDLTEDIAECFRQNKEDDGEWTKNIEEGIKKFFAKDDYKLKVLSLPGINEAVRRCVEGEDNDAFSQVIDHQIKKSIDYLMTRDIELDEESVFVELRKYREAREKSSGGDEELREVQEMLNDPEKRSRVRKTHSDDLSGDEEVDSGAGSLRGRGRGARCGRASTRARSSTRGRGRGRVKAPLDVSIVFNSRNSQQDLDGPSKGAGAASKTDTSVVKRFAAPSSQREAPSSPQKAKSQRNFYVDSSDSD